MLDGAFRDIDRGRRRSRRSKFDFPARRAFVPGVRSALCAIVELSETGAKLKVLSTQTVPDEFSLLIGGHSEVKRRCRVVWRSGTTLGVQFVGKQGGVLPFRP
jgi:hypothetical protein